MKKIRNILLIALLITTTNYLFAYKWVGQTNSQGGNNDNPQLRGTANCEPPKTSTDFEVNNVRARVNTGGDMWWDLQSKPVYEVPKGSGRHALYAGSIWVGGKDSNGQLKLAAQRFRQNGIDFWAGPLIKDGNEKGNVSAEICREYDRHFAISKKMVSDFREWYRCSHDPTCTPDPDYSIPDTIVNWPGNGPAGGYDPVLAPYYDANEDGSYNPYDGDFPYYEFVSEGITDDPDCKRPRDRKSKLYGDYTLWWVYNDRGNIHTETNGTPIGMEFRSQAFAFATNDELNNMTFYNYNITNRSTYTLYDTYFGIWTDADLGYPSDDYVGCDVTRGLGYCYNGDEYDESASGHIGYGSQPPAIGIDFFEGPYQDPVGMDKPSPFEIKGGRKILHCDALYRYNEKGDSVIETLPAPKTQDPDGLYNGGINGLNFGDGIPDNERWGMRRFLYFLNQGSGPTSDPEIAQHYYNYLIGKWKDDSPLYFNGTGHSSSPKTTTIKTDFMFPGNPTTDECNWGSKGELLGNWNEILAGNPPFDKRFVQSAGPFILKPGAVNDITLGAVFARANAGGAWASVGAVQKADDKAQTLFETCFRVLDGPDAPDMKIIELDRKLVFILSNKPSSNNYLDSYIENDKSIVEDSAMTPYYKFQGYQVYQLADNSVSISDRYNNDKAKLVFSCDVKDGVKKLVNYTWNDEKEANDAIIEALGTDNGISHSFVLDKDAFNQKTFVNNREYYFTVIAYGYNASKLYNQNDQTSFYGLKKPYLASRKNIKPYSAVPHRIDVNGEEFNSTYGYGIPVTMIEGYGNGNYVIDLTDSCVDVIMSGYPWNVRHERVYKSGYSPISVKIINPLDIPDDTYILKFNPMNYNDFGFLGIKYVASYKNNGSVQEFTYLILNSKGDTVASNIEEYRNGTTYNTLSFKFGEIKEELFINKGFSISYNLDDFSVSENHNSKNNGFIEATVELNDSLKPWLQFMPDMDGETYLNWVRAGSTSGSTGGVFNDACSESAKFLDPEGFFGKIIVLNGNWSPYFLTSPIEHGPKYKGHGINLTGIQKYTGMQALSSIDFYFTSDMSKWTRSCVIEMSEDPDKSIGAAKKFALRKSPSVDKYGKPLNDGTHGLSWFPGYAIDVRTGERLNIAFGEDSSLPDENGTDMIWNPSTNLYYPNYISSISDIKKYLFGGKHYIYVFGNTIPPLGVGMDRYDAPIYDSCSYMHSLLMIYENTGVVSRLEAPYSSAMWVSIPYLNSDYLSTALKNKEDWKNPLKFIQTDIKIRLRVATPYQKGIKEFAVADPDLVQNDNFPMFKFSTSLFSTKNEYNSVIAKDKLAGINIVPNPYYGYSTFEKEQLDTYVRITNLPKYYIIKIYNSNGSLVRTFDNRTGNNNSSYLQWDLKNENNVAIASGMYLIHIRAYDPNDKDKILGEKILKWFGALKPVDLNNF